MFISICCILKRCEIYKISQKELFFLKKEKPEKSPPVAVEWWSTWRAEARKVREKLICGCPISTRNVPGFTALTARKWMNGPKVFQQVSWRNSNLNPGLPDATSAPFPPLCRLANRSALNHSNSTKDCNFGSYCPFPCITLTHSVVSTESTRNLSRNIPFHINDWRLAPGAGWLILVIGAQGWPLAWLLLLCYLALATGNI